MADDLDDVLEEALALKASAKSARADEDWDGALEDLEDAVRLLRTQAADTPSRSRGRLAAELADAYGLIGGIHKRRGLVEKGRTRADHLRKSVAAYDQGFLYERDLEVKEASTYNRINRLVGRVLLDPTVIERGTDGRVDLSAELTAAQEILTEQIGTIRQRDPWAYTDLGTVKLLLDAPDAPTTLQDLDRLRPPAFVYNSWLTTLEPLAEVAGGLRPELRQVIERVQRSARYAG